MGITLLFVKSTSQQIFSCLRTFVLQWQVVFSLFGSSLSRYRTMERSKDSVITFHQIQEPPVKTTKTGPLVVIELNRPHMLNSLNLEMIRLLHTSLKKAASNHDCRCVVFCGAGGKAFCAGGDIKALANWVRQGDLTAAEQFFEEEYALDFSIHQFPKPVIVLADGITMGGGLGLAAGADLVIATERTRMAMPETGIGFFPDVGATRWLFDKCPKGYAEFLGLTGYEMKGADTVRCGLATHWLPSEAMAGFVEALKGLPNPVSGQDVGGLSTIHSLVEQHCEPPMLSTDQRDHWIEKHFANKASLHEIVDSLKTCASRDPSCLEILKTLAKRSPTALVLTFSLLALNKDRPLEEVFQVERNAASFMIRHPDYLEGIRAQVLEKDHTPRWNPRRIEEVEDFSSVFG